MTLAESSIHAQDPATLTPAMRQYQLYKQQYPDAILFFRIGDFYECFYEDARTVARVLSVALTSRSKSENAIPMAGVPFHAVDTYLHRMIAAGYKVAICEQMENPRDAKGVIKREVTRLVTPGTLTEDAMLDGHSENFIAAIVAAGADPATRRHGDAARGTEPASISEIENQKSKIKNPPLADSPIHPLADSVPDPLAASPRLRVAASAMAAIAWCELSTGKFLTFQGPLPECLHELARLNPREVLFPEPPDRTLPDAGIPAWLSSLRQETGCVLTARPAWQLDSHHAAQTLKSHYGVSTFAGLGYQDASAPALCAAGALVAYLHDTQKASLEHVQPPRPFLRDRFLTVDPVSLRSLEILRTLRGNSGEGSLVHALDRTCTPMGSRLLKNWLCYPLRDLDEIARRHDAIEFLLTREQSLAAVRLALESCSDIERITARICCRRASPRDLAALARSLDSAIRAGEVLAETDAATRRHGDAAKGTESANRRTGEPAGLQEIKNQKSKIENPLAALAALLPQARSIAADIRQALPDDPPGHLRDGNVIRTGFHPELDRLRALSSDSRTFLAEYQSTLIARSGIPSLKVGYNKIFGFYIEVTHTHAQKIPADFIRKQTVKSAERYITPELKQYEADILTAQERALALETELFEQLRAALAGQVEPLQNLAAAIAELDVLAGLAHLARQRRYVRPAVTTGRVLHIQDGRHPVVEQALGEQFVPNDTLMGHEEGLAAPGGTDAATRRHGDAANGTEPATGTDAGGVSAIENQKSKIKNPPTLHLITGPNMAGKSTYIRQVALLVLMAQAGSFIPAACATIGLVDRIFTRVGAADDLAAGQSTFMVEMTETANILHHATESSLVILDEIGRGTSTLDGLALAWAIAEFLAFTTRCRTLFATHYHELTELADTAAAHGFPGAVANFNVLVREWEDQIIFMHRIAPGAADKSYGVHVARLAGVPRSVVTRAKHLMSQLAVHVGKGALAGAAAAKARPTPAEQPGIFDGPSKQTLARLQSLNLDRLSPLQAWETLRALQSELPKNQK